MKAIIAAVILLFLSYGYGFALTEITPSLSVGSEYTDNITLAPDNTESDYITTVTPGITVNVMGKIAGIAASYTPSYVSYHENFYEDYWRHLANVTGWWQAGRNTRLDISNAYTKTEDPVSEEDLTVRRGSNSYTRNTSNMRINHRFGESNIVYAAFRHALLENEDPLIDDSQTTVPSIGASYWFNARWGIDLSTVYTRAEYDVTTGQQPDDYDEVYGNLRILHRFNRHTTGFIGYAHTWHDYEYSENNVLLNDYSVYDGTLGFDYSMDPTMMLSMSAGYFTRDMENAGSSSDNDGLSANLDYTKAFQRGNIALNANGGYNYTTLSSENLGFYEYYGGGLSADYDFTRVLSGDIFGLYEWRDYKDEPGGRKDDIFRTGCGLSFQLMRWLSMRAGYTYRYVESTVESNDYVENRISVSFTLQPPQPYRIP